MDRTASGPTEIGYTPYSHYPSYPDRTREVEPPSTPTRIFPPTVDVLAQAIQKESIIARFQHLGKITIIDIDKKPLKDYAGQPLPCNFQLETDDLHEAAKLAIAENLGIVVIGALTSATNNFGDKKQPENLRGVLAIKPKGLPPTQELKSTNPQNYIENKSNQLIINRDKLGKDQHTITIGAGLTYAQANEIVTKELGPEYWIAVDITSIEEALAGAVFATGGQGPSGIKLSQIATRVNMTDGKKIHTFTDPKEIEEHEGLGGNEGGFTELELKVLKRPPNRVGFRVMLKDTAGHKDYSPKAAALLTKLSPYANLKINNGILSSKAGADSIDGTEILDRSSLELAYKVRQDPLTKTILDEMNRANSDYCVYITGNSTEPFQELYNNDQPNILWQLAELDEADFLVTPLAKEITKPQDLANSLEGMRLLREAIPEIAKKQVTNSSVKPFSTSLDINFSLETANLNPAEIQAIYNKILRAFFDYEEQVTTFVGKIGKVHHTDIKMFRYGHLGRDPHTRFTIWYNEEAAKKSAKEKTEKLKEEAQELVAKAAEPNADNSHKEAAKLATERVKVVTEIGIPFRSEVVQDVGAAINVFKKRLLTTLQELQIPHPEIKIHAGEKGKMPEPEVLSAEVLARSQAIINQAQRNWNFRVSQKFMKHKPTNLAA